MSFSLEFGRYRLRFLLMGGSALCLFVLTWFYLMHSSNVTVTDLQKIQVACTEDMVRNTCVVMRGSGDDSIPSTSATVFIAGVGAIDGESYKKIYESGQEMCSTITKDCASDWNSKQCQIVRRIYLRNK